MLVVAMLAFAYASVPLYRMFCQETGFGGTTQVATRPAPGGVGARVIKVQFSANVSRDLAWDFKPLQQDVRLRPGAQGLAFYRVTNNSASAIVGMATYNVTPNKAGIYFNKVLCFCFEQQRIEAGQTIDMPVTFFIDPDFLDDKNLDDVTTLTLSYTFLNINHRLSYVRYSFSRNARSVSTHQAIIA